VFILYAVAIGVIVGLLAGGRPAGLASIHIRWAPVIAGGLLFQIVLFADPVAERVGDLGPALYLGSTIAVAAAVVRNWRIPGIPLVVAGAACNLAAVLSNGGFMPASASALAASGKAIPGMYSNSSSVADPVLWPLTDIFALPSWLPAANVFSVGDVLIGVGVAMVIVFGMRLRPTPAAGAPPAAPVLPADAGGASAH
jgi:hypothetical protein